MKLTSETEKTYENVAPNVNLCISCGREIPEGVLVCVECENAVSALKCNSCGSLLSEAEDSVCEYCRTVLLRQRAQR